MDKVTNNPHGIDLNAFNFLHEDDSIEEVSTESPDMDKDDDYDSWGDDDSSEVSEEDSDDLEQSDEDFDDATDDEDGIGAQPVKIKLQFDDGEEEWDEQMIRDSALRHKDYTKKTMALADKERELTSSIKAKEEQLRVDASVTFSYHADELTRLKTELEGVGGEAMARKQYGNEAVDKHLSEIERAQNSVNAAKEVRDRYLNEYDQERHAKFTTSLQNVVKTRTGFYENAEKVENMLIEAGLDVDGIKSINSEGLWNMIYDAYLYSTQKQTVEKLIDDKKKSNTLKVDSKPKSVKNSTPQKSKIQNVKDTAGKANHMKAIADAFDDMFD